MIDANLIAYLEDLSCLTLTPEEKIQLEGDLGDILAGMAQLSALNTAGVPERSHPFDHSNAFREDVVRSSFARELILQNAAQHNGEMFAAPQTVE
jgi:aspartyl/glutamyl-tRNA(Asn/Gln) amidotransferase C subunit